jgi:hypothetical protein
LAESDIEKAGNMAEQIASELRKSNGNLGIVYYKIEQVLLSYKKTGKDFDLIMPGIYEVDFEYGRTYPDGRSIWSMYADVLHDDLCNPNGMLHTAIKSDINISGSAVVKLITAKLNLPPSSAMIVSPVAASILGLGVKAFCKHENEC